MLARTPRHTPRHSHGMTLIELIVAIALLALVTLIAYRGLSLLERSNQQLTHESERWQDIALFFARFGNDVTQPSARPIHIGETFGQQVVEAFAIDMPLTKLACLCRQCRIIQSLNFRLQCIDALYGVKILANKPVIAAAKNLSENTGDHR